MNASERGLSEAVEVFLDRLIRLQQGENLLVSTDERDDRRLAEAIADGAHRRGGRSEILLLDSTTPLTERVKTINGTMQQGLFRVLCELPDEYYYLTDVWRRATASGARVYGLAGLDASSFIRCVGEVDHERMSGFGMALKGIIEGARGIRVTTRNGTDLRMKLDLHGSRLLRLARKARRRLGKVAGRCAEHAGLRGLAARLRPDPASFVFPPSGLLGPGQATFLGGQLAFRGLPSTIAGRVVIDGFLHPGAGGAVTETPVTLTIEGGSVVEFGGCPAHVSMLRQRFEGQPARIAHLCIGFNPGARLTGRLLEAERAFGCLTVGFGEGALHTDGVIRSPSLTTERLTIEQDGAFVGGILPSLVGGLSRCGQEATAALPPAGS